MAAGDEALHPLPVSADDAARAARYTDVAARLDALLAGESDWVAAQATVVCELHHAFECASCTMPCAADDMPCCRLSNTRRR
jgi:hypothetical protein